MRPKILLIGSILISLLLAEVVVRCLGRMDSDGNFFLGSCQLKPYYVSLKKTTTGVKKYFSSPDSFLLYDPILGWSPRPHSRNKTGLSFSNADGILAESVDTVIPRKPPDGVLRIAVFGDSFTAGDNIPLEETWGYYLEKELQAQGIRAEVLNFGMWGYGMDQAYLRWLTLGRQFSPHIVIFGFCLENMARNVNLIRPLYHHRTGLSFSKPRFILKENQLTLVNSPALPPDKIAAVMSDPASWELIKYEYWWDKKKAGHSFVYHSKLLSLIDYVVETVMFRVHPSKDENIYDPGGEPALVTNKIMQSFARDVESRGSKFYIAFLPWQSEVKKMRSSQPLPYEEFLRDLGTQFPVIHTEDALAREVKRSGFKAVYNMHYTGLGDKVVARVVSQYLLQHKDEWIKLPAVSP